MGSIDNMDDLQVDTSYKLPRGGREAIRLTAQHHVLASRQGYLLHPEVSNAIKDIAAPRIADVATGTGIWAIDIGQKMPNAQVVGLDIADQQFPASWTWPSNVSLELYDLLEDVPTQYQEYFDVVHVRLLLTAGPNVDKSIFIDRFRSLLRPGGWLQWDELEFPHISACYPSPKGVLKSSDPGAHPLVQVMEKYWKLGEKAGWIKRFENVFERAGGFELVERGQVPVRPHLLQMESDLVVSVMSEFVNVAAVRTSDSKMMAECHAALAALCADVENGALFSYNWNVCIARRLGSENTS